jgi:flagellar hook-length control protein FliK
MPIAEVAGKISPMVSDQPAQPSDLAVVLQPGAQTNTPGAAPAGKIGTTTPAPPQTPMQQASAALVRLAADAPGRIELTLTPETLGRVHFDMRPEGAGLAITVSAERSETLDLIRRHLPDLLAELRQAGVQAGTLSFGSWAEGQSAPSKEGWTKTHDDDPAPTPLDRPAPVHQPTLAVTGLNLRL